MLWVILNILFIILNFYFRFCTGKILILLCIKLFNDFVFFFKIIGSPPFYNTDSKITKKRIAIVSFISIIFF